MPRKAYYSWLRGVGVNAEKPRSKVKDLTEEHVLKTICTDRLAGKTFEEIISGFEEKLKNFNPVENCFELENYFGAGKGVVTSRNLLLRDEKIGHDWLRTYETKEGKEKIDFKGLYVFVHDDTPFYVGISKGVIGRLGQHLKGKNHNTSTLAFKMGLIRFEILNSKKFKGKRKDLNYETDVEPIKKLLLRQKVAFLQIDNDDELALFEIYCSKKLKTMLNSFQTH